MVRIRTGKSPRICQGDVIKNVEYIEYVSEKKGNIEVSKIVFPLSIVLTQDCDLDQDYKFRWSHKRRLQANNGGQDKWLMSVIVAPIYNVEHVYAGEHLSELEMNMAQINRKRTPGKNLQNNETPRYHYIEFPEESSIPSSVIDFKHYYSVNVAYLKKHKRNNYACQIGTLFRENISHRFASYLSRIGLP